jgi:hypothetical protein
MKIKVLMQDQNNKQHKEKGIDVGTRPYCTSTAMITVIPYSILNNTVIKKLNHRKENALWFCNIFW